MQGKQPLLKKRHKTFLRLWVMGDGRPTPLPQGSKRLFAAFSTEKEVLAFSGWH
jgi:hypothetical protein